MAYVFVVNVLINRCSMIVYHNIYHVFVVDDVYFFPIDNILWEHNKYIISDRFTVAIKVQVINWLESSMTCDQFM